MDTLEAIKRYIIDEQMAGVNKAQEHQDCPHTYGDEYYHGYYNGYLTALYNINLVIVKNDALQSKSTPL